MQILNTFDSQTTEIMLNRLNNLSPTSQAQWGKMNVAQMLAHLNISYDMAFGKVKGNYNFFMKIMLKAFVKKIVVGDKPYAKNSRTAPIFIISNEKEFEAEKLKLQENIKETELKGASYFEGKESEGFGILSAKEWSNMFYKHLDHHFSQFGV